MAPFATEELEQLQKELIAKNPTDVLQFCANFFNSKLALQRNHLWQVEAKAKAAGIELFPHLEAGAIDSNGQGTIPCARQPSFKSPFGDNDPHSDHTSSHDFSERKEDSAGLFKGGFGVGKQTHNPPAQDLDPNDPAVAAPAEPTVKKNNKLPLAFNANRRTSVSAEAMNPDKFKSDSWKPPVNDLTEEQRQELAKTLSLNFLFQQLDKKAKATVVAALQKKQYTQGDEIITQGDVGDYFYIIESGTVDFYVNGTKVNTSSDGSSFGELALMYNSPRAATAVAASDVTCWALDRATFRRILLEGTFNRRIMYEDFLKDVTVLRGLTHQERSKLADALSTEMYHAGDNIVTEGETGDKFYLIESGTCEISKEAEGVIGTIGKGNYFGEVALLNDLPRQATVKALDNVIVATLDKSGFTRLLGPALDLLREKDPTAASTHQSS
uniref:cAMP-dependent protein kinase regulatory subunit n=1 Tax=Candidozyma auris TaxID=498019 RepID=A0A0L0P3K4_CANAR